MSRSAIWTDAQDRTLSAMWNAGAACSEIAERLGKTKNAIIGRRSRIGLPMRSSPLQTSKERTLRLDQFAELLAEGHAVPAIARTANISTDTARGMLQRLRRDLGAQAI